MLTSISLHAHTARGSQSRYNRRRHRCNDLHNKLKCFFLTHGSPPLLITFARVVAVASGIASGIASGVATAAISGS